MKIKSIELCNFRATKNLKLSFSSQLNVLVGINGGGKSTVLDALAFNLSWLVNRIQRAGVSGRPIPEGSIRNGESQAYLDLWVEWDQQSFRWALQRTIQGRNAEELSKLDGASQLAKILQERHEKSESLPVVVYYPVNRIIGSTTPELSSKDSIYALDIYEDSLGGKSNFRSFFEWFRIQDDIVNEHAQYSSKWLARNSHQFRRGVKNALKKLQGELISREMYVNEEAFFSVNDLLKDDVVFKKPTFLFRELVRWVERIEVPHFKQHVELFHEFDYMLHRLLSMSNDYRDIPEDSFNEIYLDVLERTLHKVFNFCGTNSPLGFFMWDIFSCANSLSLWWMSDLGRKEVERVFRGARNDLKRSPLYLSDTSFLTSMRQILKKELKRKKNAQKNEGRELFYVKKAIEEFVPEYENLRIERFPSPQMLVDKNGCSLNLDQLSDGEKNIIALVGDLARRLALGNPHARNPLTGEGIVLIDEIDLHLHPAWQRLIISKIPEVFPNCQFIISTHSPQIISHVKPEDIILLNRTKKGIIEQVPVIESLGKNTDRILEDIMSVDARPEEYKLQIEKVYDLIQENILDEASNLVNSLRLNIGDDPALIKATILIARKRSIGK